MSNFCMDQMPSQMGFDGSSFTRMPVRRLGNISQSEPSVNAGLKISRENPKQPVNVDPGAGRGEEIGHWL
jgi:hypothetical protein